MRIILKGKDETNRVLKYTRVGNKYEITFNNGKTYGYSLSNVQIIESALNLPDRSNCFDYLKRIADEVGLKIKSKEGDVFNSLSYSYSKIDFVDPDSLFGMFLGASFNQLTSQRTQATQDVVYPFGFNASQKDAIGLALNNRLSVIEGPPGTGKTQTILNIIANAIIRGESVAVVSNNNSATLNVFDKLKKYDVGFIAAYLGSIDNKADFINSQKPIPNISNWEISSQELEILKSSLKSKHEKLTEMLLQQQNLSVLKQELSSVETELKHFIKYSKINFEEISKNIKKVENSQKALEMWMLCEIYGKGPNRKGLIEFIKNFIQNFKLMNKNFFYIRKILNANPCSDVIAIYQRQFYDLKIEELNKNILNLSKLLLSYDFNRKMKEYTDISMQVFKASLAIKYADQERKEYVIEELKSDSENFIADYPVVLSTTYSLRSSLANNVMYDYVIIDESSQVNLCTGGLALSCARKAVVVGDLKQLSHVVDSTMEKATDSIFYHYKLAEFYRYKSHSLLSSIMAIFPQVPKTLLREHYRCHPKIIEFCNKKFYGGQLVVLTEHHDGDEPLIVYKTVEGNHERNRLNQRQIDVIKNEIIPRHALNLLDDSLGIISPYRNQTNALQKEFAGMGVKADTVDKFQGRENEVIILSTVDNEISDFVDNRNRLNVAISRAVKKLILVVSDDVSQKDSNINDLVKYIEYNNLTIVESNIRSVFDYLYHSYTQRRIEYLSRYKRISKFDSENIMYSLIVDVLREKEMSCLEVSSNVSLKMIFHDSNLMTNREKSFAMNILSHVDFLIYDNVTKIPKFAVEVDGVSFHDNNDQKERDRLKDEIFRKHELPLLRFRTNGSEERKKLIEILDVIV